MKSGKITDAVFRKASLWAKLAGCLLAFGLLLSLSGCSAEEPVKLVRMLPVPFRSLWCT